MGLWSWGMFVLDEKIRVSRGGVSLQTHSDKYLRFQISTASHQGFSFQFWKDIETPGCYFHPLSDMFQLNCFHWYYDSDMICVATDTVTPGPNDTDFSLSLPWAHVVRCDNQSGNIYRQPIKRKKSLSRFSPQVHRFENSLNLIFPFWNVKNPGWMTVFLQSCLFLLRLRLSDAGWQDDWCLVSTFIWRHSAIRKH